MSQQQLVVVANRLPVRKQRGGGWQTSPGGLVSALEPTAKELGAAWVGWHGTTAQPPEPFVHDNIRIVPIGIGREERDGYYRGFANRTLWPLYHDAVARPEFRRRWWDPYVAVNERFALKAAEVAARGALVWVHDYHLQLVPAMLRALRPDLHIGFFLHIPFPPMELFAQLPWRRQLLEGLLGADVIGFQRPLAAQNFIGLAARYAGARPFVGGVAWQGRDVRASAFPISIDYERYDRGAREAKVLARAERLRRDLGGERRVLMGIDRLDYTKGIELRLRAYQELLRSGRQTIEDCVFVQVAVPSRELVEEYVDLRGRVDGLVGEINGEQAEVGRAAVHYLRRTLPFEELVAMYRTADVMVVNPVRDGMNLVAKEYVATRFDDSGALVLSEFAGAAGELEQALLINPHDLDATVAAFDRALRMPPEEASRRMASMRATVAGHTVHDWTRAFLAALSGAGERARASGQQVDTVARSVT
jgi:trehalose 6-phosphate synthase